MRKLDARMDGATVNIVAENVERLRELFPDAFIESSAGGEPRFRVDLDALREILGDYGEEQRERFSFVWNGKSRARRIAQTPSTAALRPAPAESVSWDTTRNLVIEGDNLEVLKLLQKSYHKRAKVIYIDPPYNTGKEFIYPDRFADPLDAYLRYTGQVDDQGFKLSTHDEKSGRFHTNWLNMMLPRLRLARNILRDDGAIFISIDDREVANLRKLCDEVFGEENLLANLVWEKAHTRKNSARFFSVSHDHIVAYAKRKGEWDRHLMPREDTSAYDNPDDDPKGRWKADPIYANNPYKADYTITKPNGVTLRRPRGRYWRFSESSLKTRIEAKEVLWGEADAYPMVKRYLSEVQDGLVPVTLLTRAFAGDNASANHELKDLLGVEKIMDYPKPSSLIARLAGTTMGRDDILMDFFAGSGTSGHSVLNLNAADGGSRRFILVQLPERCPASSVAAEAGLRTIAEICKQRLRCVIKRISADQQRTRGRVEGSSVDGDGSADLDLGFKVFKLDSSSVKPWDANLDDLESALSSSVETIKSDRSALDVAYELLLKFGLDLAAPFVTRTLAGKTVFVIGGGELVVCLARDVTRQVAEGIGKLKDELQPKTMRVVFRDSGFAGDVVKTNALQILRKAGIDHVRSV